MSLNLKSFVNQKGKTVTQIVTSITGVKKTIRGIKTDSIQQGQFTKFETTDGRMVLINDSNVFCVEVFSEN